MASIKEKIGYALGDAGSGGITWKIMSTCFPFFFTGVFGLSLVDAGVLMLVARLFDVVTDPIMGSLADRTQSRWGVYRPWLIFGAIPYGIIFALLLYTPELGEVGKRVYAYTVYLLMMVMYTAVNVPYGSLLGVMTDDDNEKNQFSAYRMVGAYAMGFITLAIFPYVMDWLGSGRPDSIETKQYQYSMIGIIFGSIAALMTLLCGLLTRERVKQKRTEKFDFSQFANLFKNKPWIYLTSIGVCTNFFNGFRYAVAAYMFTYCINGATDGQIDIGILIINYTMFMAIGEVTCMIFGAVSPVFTKWVGSKRMAFVWSSVICFVTSVAFFFIPMERSAIWWMIIVSILTSIGAGLYSPLLWSMYADVADFATNKFGKSSTGLIFSSGTMAQKLGGAVSGALITILLAAAGATMMMDGNTEVINPASITPSVKEMIWALFSLFPAGLAILMGVLAYFFPIKK